MWNLRDASLALTMALSLFACRGAPTAEPASSPSTEAAAQPEATTKAAARPAKAQRKAPPPWKPLPRPEDCADCHPDIVENYARTGMGRSFYPPKQAKVIEDFTPGQATITHPTSGLTYRAYVDDEGRWWQEETLAGTDHRRVVEVKWVVGSGNHTRSYMGEVNGQVVQMPLTWYVRRAIWDLSPGYTRPDHKRFDRWMLPECLFCHNDPVPPVAGQPSAYSVDQPHGLSCGRCHGDGTAHMEARFEGQTPPEGQPDPHIINPKHLSSERQLEICQQCHLQGEGRVLAPGAAWHRPDPSKPITELMSIFVKEKDGGPEFGIASHGHRMAQSACAKKSQGKLVCTTCHNPHKPAEEGTHRAACLTCHTPEQCGDEHGMAADADCARCHMRQAGTDDIPHVKFTDHYIRKRPGTEGEGESGSMLDLIDAHRGEDHSPDGRARLGLAHADRWQNLGEPFQGSAALVALRNAGEADPGSLGFAGWHKLALLERSKGNLDKALEAFERLEREEALTEYPHPWWRLDLAEFHMAEKRYKAAEAAVRAQIERYPDAPARVWRRLGDVLGVSGQHTKADAAYAEAMKRDPHDGEAARSRAANAMNQKKPEEARRWLEEALRRDAYDPWSAMYLSTLLQADGDQAGALKQAAHALRLRADLNQASAVIQAAVDSMATAEAARAGLAVLGPHSRKHPQVWWAVARLADRAGDRKQAQQAIDAGLKLAPRHPGLVQMANTYKQR